MGSCGISRREAAFGAGAVLSCAASPPAVAAPSSGRAELKFDVVADGMKNPEGPVLMKDGSVIVMEAGGGVITRISPEGRKQRIAAPDGAPAGGAIGPDGALYVANIGGMQMITTRYGLPLNVSAQDYGGGRIERLDLATGQLTRLYEDVDGRKLQWPDDLVFDASGGFWFTDIGQTHRDGATYGGIYYARADGAAIKCISYGPRANGIGLSPDGRTLYASLPYERLIVAFDITAAGEAALSGGDPYSRVVASLPAGWIPDSLKVTADGGIVQALPRAVAGPGIAQVDVASGAFVHHPIDGGATNMCFGGPDMRDMWITSHGRLLKTRWYRPGLRATYAA